MIKRQCLLTFLIMLFFAIKSFALEGTDMRNKLKDIDKSGAWKEIWCDGYEIYLCTLPYSRSGPKLFEVENKKFMLIGHRELSPDAKKIAFTLDTYKRSAYQGLISRDLYLINSDGTNLTKLPTDEFKNLFLIGFLGNDKLVFENSEKENYLTKPGTSVIYTLNLSTNKIEKFSNQKISHNALNASSKGDLLIYSEHLTSFLYDVVNNSKEKLNINDKGFVLSPDGKKILFRRGATMGSYYDMMESYYMVNIDGANEELVLSNKKIQALLRSSGSYRDLHFESWSPDSKFVLFAESSDRQKGKLFILDVDTKEIIKVK